MGSFVFLISFRKVVMRFEFPPLLMHKSCEQFLIDKQT